MLYVVRLITTDANSMNTWLYIQLVKEYSDVSNECGALINHLEARVLKTNSIQSFVQESQSTISDEQWHKI